MSTAYETTRILRQNDRRDQCKISNNESPGALALKRLYWAKFAFETTDCWLPCFERPPVIFTLACIINVSNKWAVFREIDVYNRNPFHEMNYALYRFDTWTFECHQMMEARQWQTILISCDYLMHHYSWSRVYNITAYELFISIQLWRDRGIRYLNSATPFWLWTHPANKKGISCG